LVQKALTEAAEKARAERYEEFKKRQTDPARAARDKELAAIFTPGLTDQKVLETAAAARSMKVRLDVAAAWEKGTGIPTGKRTYVAAYGGVNRGAEPGLATGPLSTGYGARPSAFGPEYAFGIMMEKALDQPVLIIKTAWGGKSLHYDFRPPSAGPYQPTTGEKEQLERWKTRKAAWDKYLADGGTAAEMIKMEKDIKSIENEKRNLQASLAKLPKEQQSEMQAKITALNDRSKELRGKLVPPPGDMPTRDAAGFYWNEMIGFTRKVLADPKAYHPEYDPEAGFEVAGGVWFQGFNDQFDPSITATTAATWCISSRTCARKSNNPRCPS
jgi:hypothetical protein